VIHGRWKGTKAGLAAVLAVANRVFFIARLLVAQHFSAQHNAAQLHAGTCLAIVCLITAAAHARLKPAARDEGRREHC